MGPLHSDPRVSSNLSCIALGFRTCVFSIVPQFFFHSFTVFPAGGKSGRLRGQTTRAARGVRTQVPKSLSGLMCFQHLSTLILYIIYKWFGACTCALLNSIVHCFLACLCLLTTMCQVSCFEGGQQCLLVAKVDWKVLRSCDTLFACLPVHSTGVGRAHEAP